MTADDTARARDAAHHLHPYTDPGVHERTGPHIITRGEGIHVWDTDGNAYIEGLAGLWCVTLGFSEPRLVDAAKRQMETLPFYHSFGGRAPEVVGELAERLIAQAPGAMNRVFFTNSGSEANDSLIKLTWACNNGLGRPEKKKIIARQGSYHGITLATAGLTHLPYARTGFDVPLNDRFLATTCPNHFREARPDESEEAFADRLAADLDRLIEAEGPHTVAAFIAEPVLGAGGVIPPPATYFDKVQAVLKKHDVFLIADEVICGFGRTGNRFGSETYGLDPDMVTLAKGLSSGYQPIGAALMSERVYEGVKAAAAETGMLGTGFTYSGHPVPVAVALEALRLYEERDVVGMTRARTPHFQARLHALADHPLVGDTRGVGLLGGVEVVADPATGARFDPATGAAKVAARHCMDHGLFVRPLPGDTLGVCPPLIITEAEIDALFDRLRAGLDSAADALGVPRG